MADRKTPKQQVTDAASVAWNTLPWRKLEQHVYRIQKRIYRASQQGNVRKVQKLEKLLMKSEAARLLAVRRVTQDNQGKKTAGIDGVKSVSPAQRFPMASQVHPKNWKKVKPKPVRRVWIPKPGKAEKRPLGIPTMLERSKQALAKMALEPEWEAKFDANSYGFRPGRSCHDAIGAIFLELRYKPKFVLDADIKGCFDNINQEALLQKLQTYPTLRQTVKGWLKAGVLEAHVFTPTETGTPQGGVISPLLANIALHGLEQVVTSVCRKSEVKPTLIRYADDFVILHTDLTKIQQAQARVSQWLADMGLLLSPTKTKVRHTLDPHEGESPGFDFLGFQIRQYRVGKYHTGKSTNGTPLGFKTIIKPNKEAVKRHIRQLKEKIRRLETISQGDLIGAINPIIVGWTNYYKTVVATKTFSQCDHHLWRQLVGWCLKRHHRNRSRKWVRNKYWKHIGNRMAFAASEKIKVRWHTETHIQRHAKVKGSASPYDGNLIYWAKRLSEQTPAMRSTVARLLQAQKVRCAGCNLYFRDGDMLEVDHIIPVAIGGDNTLNNKRVYHRHCHDEKTAEDWKLITEFKAAGINDK